MNRKAIADGLVRKYGTRNPFVIADEMGFIVVFVPLVGMRGFQQAAKRRRFIYINSELDEMQQQLVCAHELAHHLLHKGMNRIFMDQYTHTVTQKYENEADLFAVELLYGDEDLRPYLERGAECAVAYMGVPYKLAEQRLQEVAPEPPAATWP